jgi:hypothetical protein
VSHRLAKQSGLVRFAAPLWAPIDPDQSVVAGRKRSVLCENILRQMRRQKSLQKTRNQAKSDLLSNRTFADSN